MSRLQITLSAAAAMLLVSNQGCIRVNSSSATAPSDAQTQADAAPTEEATVPEQGVPSAAVVAPSPVQDEAGPAEPATKPELPATTEMAVPVCKKTGTRSEGWYSNGELLRYGPCEGIKPECKMSGTRSEGWYSGDELIEYDQCDGKLPSEE